MSTTTEPKNPATVPETTPPSPKVETVTADSLIEENVKEGMPPPVTGEKATDANVTIEPPAQAPSFAEPQTNPELIDKSGQKFDPERHRTGADGKPLRNFKGNFYGSGRPKKKPSAAAGQSTTGNGAPVFDLPEGLRPPPPPDKFAPMAEMILRIGYGPLELMFGEEIKTSPQEHLMLKEPLTEWLRVSDMEDLPPWLAFACISVAVYGPKFAKPSVRDRAILLWLKIRRFFGKEKRPDFVKSPDKKEPEQTANNSDASPDLVIDEELSRSF